jgi:putative tryptophan/tyrosine transport system substrate-binding protein
MQRRDFIMLLGGAAAAWPRGAQAQRSAIPVIGYVGSGNRPSAADQAFREGLAKMGFTQWLLPEN